MGVHLKIHTGKARRSIFTVATVVAVLTFSMPFAVHGVQAQAASDTTELLSGYNQWNIVTFGDARLTAESEGAVAVGGELSFSGTQVAMQHVTDQNFGLLAKGVDLNDSTGELKVNNGSVRIGNASGLDTLNRDSNNASVPTKVVAEGAEYDSSPDVVSQNSSDDSSTVVGPNLFSGLFSQGSAETLAETIVQNTHDLSMGVAADASIQGTSAVVSLTKGKTNYWSVSASELSSLSEINFTGETPSAQDGTFLIVSITGEGSVTFNLTMAGSRDPGAILWVDSSTTTISQQGDTIDGSLFAPKATLEKTSANIQGTIVVDNGDFGGSEQHYYPYKGIIPEIPDGSSSVTPKTPSTSDSGTPNTPTDSGTTPTVKETTTAPSTPTTAATGTQVSHPTGSGTFASKAQAATDSQEVKNTAEGSSLAKTGAGYAVMMAMVVGLCAMLIGFAAIHVARRTK